MNESIEKTNKEKADQLVKLSHSYEEGLVYIHTDRVLYENLMEMAKWKDKQFKSIIDEIKANIIESRDSKDYRPAAREVTLNWVLRLIDEITTK